MTHLRSRYGQSAETSAFLKSRRDKITPEQAGLPVYGTRRVSGLRRSGVASLAGVRVEYYTRLERGNLSGVSDSVLDALAQALRLDDTERTHLYDLARAAHATPARTRRRPAQPTVRPSVRRIVEGIPNGLAVDPAGRTLYVADSQKGTVWAVQQAAPRPPGWSTPPSRSRRPRPCRVDDFNFLSDRSNLVFAALNTQNQIAVVYPNGTTRTVLTASDGLASPTATAVRGMRLYITDGGLSEPHDAKLQSGKINLGTLLSH